MSEKPVDQVRWGDTGSVKSGLPLSDRAAWLLVSHDSPKGREDGEHMFPLPFVCHPSGWQGLLQYNTIQYNTRSTVLLSMIKHTALISTSIASYVGKL